MSMNPYGQVPAGAAMLREVIFVESSRGTGEPGNEIATVHQYWSKEGVLLAEYDTKWEDPAWPACACRTADSAATKPVAVTIDSLSDREAVAKAVAAAIEASKKQLLIALRCAGVLA